MASTVDYPVVIIGAGLGGLALGAMLKKLGIGYKILERTVKLEPAGAGISLSPNALHVLDQIGCYDEIKRESQQMKKIQIMRNSTLWRVLDFSNLPDYFGYPVLSIERHLFHNILYKHAGAEESVTFGAKVVDIIDDSEKPHVVVKLEDGTEFTCYTAIGADGIRSVTRRILARNAGLEAKNTITFTGRVHFSGYTAPLKHLGEAELGVANWMLYDRGILTTWPCKDNRQWFIGVKPADPSKTKDIDRSVWGSLSKEEINAAYGAQYHPFAESGKFSDIVDKAERVIGSNVFQESDFPSMAAGRVAMLGDAAHSMTSFFGQGACQAMEDATELANALQVVFAQEKPDTTSIVAAYEEYCAIRQPRARALVNFSGGYARLHTAMLPYSMGPLVRRLFYGYAPVWVMIQCVSWLYGHQPTLKGL